MSVKSSSRSGPPIAVAASGESTGTTSATFQLMKALMQETQGQLAARKVGPGLSSWSSQQDIPSTADAVSALATAGSGPYTGTVADRLPSQGSIRWSNNGTTTTFAFSLSGTAQDLKHFPSNNDASTFSSLDFMKCMGLLYPSSCATPSHTFSMDNVSLGQSQALQLRLRDHDSISSIDALKYLELYSTDALPFDKNDSPSVSMQSAPTRIASMTAVVKVDATETVGPETTGAAATKTSAPKETGMKKTASKKRTRIRKDIDVPESEREYVADHDRKAADVLMGRGGLLNDHAGNKAFHAMKRTLLCRYQAATKHQKTVIAQELVDLVAASGGGRFLKQDDATQRWYVASKLQARNKAGQALREVEYTPEAGRQKRARYKK